MSVSDKLKHGSELHTRVLRAICSRIEMSEQDLSDQVEKWEKAEKDFVFHIDESEVDTIRKTQRDGGKPQYTTVQVPYSYAQMMTAHTYLSSVFLSRTPVMQYQARHGEPEMNVQAVEALMDYQTQIGGHMAAYYVWLHDALKYGVGIIGNYWEKERHTVSDLTEEPVTILGQPVEGKTKEVKTVRTIEGYEGNRVFNVRPQDYLPDTRVPIGEPQRGEFTGRKVDIGWNTIVKRKLSNQYFNIDHVEGHLKLTTGGGFNQRRASIVEELELPGETTTAGVFDTRTSLVSTLPGVEMVIEIIPTEWELGTTENPEKWVFTVLDRKVIIEARPYGRWHNRFPFEVIENEIEGYALTKRGMMEIGEPLNDIMTWLFNSHFYSVRKTINGDIIFDPSRVVSSDIMNSDGTGSRIRLKPAGYGQDVRAMVHTLQGGADITGTHLRDSEVVASLLQRVLGVTDNIIGAVNPGGRKTATEVRTASSASVNRLRTQAEYMSAHGFAPHSQQLLQTTQQLYSAEKKFRIVGDTMWAAEQFATVTPEMIAGFYDYSPVDGTLPIDRFAMVNMWSQLFAQIQRMPDIMQQYNMADIFAWVAQLAGIKNIKQFRVQVLPPGVQGQGVPLGGAGGPGGSGADAGGGAARGGGQSPVVPLPQQVPGVGSSG